MSKSGPSNLEQLDHDLFQAMGRGVLLLDLEGGLVRANPAAQGLLLSLGAEEETRLEPGGEWESLIKGFSAGRPVGRCRLDFGDHWLDADCFPVYVEQSLCGVAAYLDEPVAASFKLQENREADYLLDALMESSYDGLWICNAKADVVRVNRAALGLLGLRPEEVLHRNVKELLEKGLISESVTMEVLRRKTVVTMVQHLKSQKKILVTGSPIFDGQGKIAYVVINDRDITLLDRMRRQLGESQAQLEHFRAELSEMQLKELESGYYICTSREMKRVYQAAVRVAASNSTVLITGESGVGKGMMAKLIHRNSPRAQGPFTRVDCAAIPESLFESEMFGYEPGAFTGARKGGKPGLIEMAQGGTLFLDEVADIPLAHQVKLLRFLDDRRLIRVGGKTDRKIETRVIAATNRNLAREVDEGRFRRDLFYRFNVVPLHVPPLRERPRDILGLMRFFVQKLCEENKLAKDINSAARSVLLSYDYPGNVRELENIVERVLIMSPGQKVSPDDLPLEVWSQPARMRQSDWRADMDIKQRLARVEHELISRAVKRFGSQRKAARHLGISQSSIARKLAKGGVVDSKIDR